MRAFPDAEVGAEIERTPPTRQKTTRCNQGSGDNAPLLLDEKATSEAPIIGPDGNVSVSCDHKSVSRFKPHAFVVVDVSLDVPPQTYLGGNGKKHGHFRIFNYGWP
jgi:hypothetical protein